MQYERIRDIPQSCACALRTEVCERENNEDMGRRKHVITWLSEWRRKEDGMRVGRWIGTLLSIFDNTYIKVSRNQTCRSWLICLTAQKYTLKMTYFPITEVKRRMTNHKNCLHKSPGPQFPDARSSLSSIFLAPFQLLQWNGFLA